MTGIIKVNELTFNRISVTWEVATSITACTDGPATSPPFILECDGHSIIFNMFMTWVPEYSITIKKNDDENSVRAIMTLATKFCERPSNVQVEYIDYWYKATFKGGLPPWRIGHDNQRGRAERAEPSIIKLGITVLGYMNSSKVVKKPQPLYFANLPFDNNLHSNVTLVIDNKEIPAHKTILTLHSPVFMGMFEAPMRESKENRVVIEDVEFETMEWLIKMMYTGDGPKEVNPMLKVLVAAEKYQMSSMKRACEAKLQMMIYDRIAVELFKQAEMHNADELFRTCLEFILVKKLLPFDKVKEVCCQPKHYSILADLLMEKSVLKL